MMYGSWDTKHNRQNLLSFWTIISPFTPLTTWKIKIWKKYKKAWRYNLFIHVYHKWQSYAVWFLRYWVWRTEFFLILDHFLLFYPLTTQKIKILKKTKKRPGDIIVLHMCTINGNHVMYCSWNMICDGRTDRWTFGRMDGRTDRKSDI